jgi:geranylgeranyl diphosphate synthase type I
LGLAFQVRDDWLGIWGESAVTGKSRDCDLGRRKVTYPVVAGYRAMGTAERRRFERLFRAHRSNGHDDAAELRSMLEHQRADDLAAAAGGELAGQAIALVDGCSFATEHRDQFEEFACYVANRPR